MSSIFLATAMAQAAGSAPKQPSMAEMLILPLGFGLIMYFLIFRPQQKKAKEHTKLLESLKVGDEVVTTGGVIGKIKAVAEGFVTLDISSNGTMKVVRSHVTGLTKSPNTKASLKKPK